jgi:hypothetical protein
VGTVCISAIGSGVGQLFQGGELAFDQRRPIRRGNAVSALPLLHPARVCPDRSGNGCRAVAVFNDLLVTAHRQEGYVNYRREVKHFGRFSTRAVANLPEMTGQSDRLRKARVAAGYKSGAEAARRHGFKANTYKSNENGHAPFGFEQAKAYGKAYDVRPEWLYDGKLPVKERGPRVVPLVGYVGAGAEAHFYSTGDEGLGEVEAPDGADETSQVFFLPI